MTVIDRHTNQSFYNMRGEIDMSLLEKDIERHLREGIKSLGGWCLKFVSPGFTGVPDRIVLMPGGKLCFVELKRPGQHERSRLPLRRGSRGPRPASRGRCACLCA